MSSFIQNVNKLAISLYGDSNEPINVSTITNNIRELLLISASIENGNMAEYITKIAELEVDVQEAFDGEFFSSYDIDTNILTLRIPKGEAGEKGDKPLITFALDGSGNLSYEITYEHDYADGIGAY